MAKRTVVALVVVAATLVTFLPLCGHGFTVWDDPLTIWQNPMFKPPSLEHMMWFLLHPYMGLYVPVTYAFWQLLGQIAWHPEPDYYGMMLDASVYHVGNVLLHVTNALLTFVLLRKLVKRDWPAACGALVFALHPVQVETVGWISGSKDLLYGFFALVAIWQYICFAELQQGIPNQALPGQPPEPNGRPESSFRKDKRRRQARQESDLAASAPGRHFTAREHYAVATAAFILGFFSKPTALVIPLLAGTIDLLLLHRPWKRVTLALLPWMVLVGPFMFITKIVQGAEKIPSTPLWTKPIIALDALAFYVYKLILPLNLTLDYGHHPIYVMTDPSYRPWLYLTWIIPVGLGLLLLWQRKRRPFLVAAGLWFVVGLLPVLGLVKFLFQWYSTNADHYLYIPMVGVGLAAAGLVALRPTRAVAVACTVLLSLWSIRSVHQTTYWKNGFTLFTHAVASTPRSAPMRNNLATAIDLEGDAVAHRHNNTDDPEAMAIYASSEHLYREALKVMPGNPKWRQNLAMNLTKRGLFFDALKELELVWYYRNDVPPGQTLDVSALPMTMGLIAMNLHDYPRAVHWLEVAIEQKMDQQALAMVRQKLAEARQKVTASATQPIGPG